MAIRRKPKPKTARAKTTRAIATVPAQPDNMIAVIAQAMRDPAVDPQKMRDLLELHRELERDVDRREYARHMSMLQSEITQIAVDCANPQTNSKYASYQALDRALRPYYTAHGFSVSFTQADCPKGQNWVRVVCTVTWGSCEKQHYADVQADQLGPKGNKVMTATHASASASSYGRRYALGYAFNLVTQRDDDGNAASQRYITASQVTELELIINEYLDGKIDEICKVWEIDSLSEIPRNAFDKVKTRLLARAQAKTQ